MSYNPKAQQENGNRKLAGCLLYFWPWTNIDFYGGAYSDIIIFSSSIFFLVSKDSPSNYPDNDDSSAELPQQETIQKLSLSVSFWFSIKIA